MSSSRKHRKFEKHLLKDCYIELIDLILDNPDEVRKFGNKHRKISHTWERLRLIKDIYGETGLAQALIHIWLDYGI